MRGYGDQCTDYEEDCPENHADHDD
jgi:hypothetical protein